MKKLLLTAGFIIAASALQAQGLPSEKYLPLDVAIEAATAALKQCKTDGHPVSVEVMNHNARVLVTYHDPFTTIHSAYSAHAKAYTVLSYSRASGETTSAQIAAGARIAQHRIGLGMRGIGGMNGREGIMKGHERARVVVHDLD